MSQIPGKGNSSILFRTTRFRETANPWFFLSLYAYCLRWKSKDSNWFKDLYLRGGQSVYKCLGIC